jgi:hypothetical protein
LASLAYNAFEWPPAFQDEIDEIIAEVEAEKSK